MDDVQVDAGARRRLALDFMAGLLEHDFDRMRSALADDATWSVPGATAVSGVARGAEAVVDRARAITASGDVRIELRFLLEGWDAMAVLLHNTGRRGEVLLDEEVVIAFRVGAGRIVSAANLISDVPGLDAFFAAGSSAEV